MRPAMVCRHRAAVPHGMPDRSPGASAAKSAPLPAQADVDRPLFFAIVNLDQLVPVKDFALHQLLHLGRRQVEAATVWKLERLWLRREYGIVSPRLLPLTHPFLGQKSAQNASTKAAAYACMAA